MRGQQWAASLLMVAVAIAVSGGLQAKIVTVQTEGMGQDVNSARHDALRDAVMQVTGITVSGDTIREMVAKIESDGQNQKMRVDDQLVQRFREQYKGYVDSFRVISQSRDPATGMWNVRLEVAIDHYEAPGLSDTRRSISVQAVEATPGRCFGQAIDPTILSRSITDSLQTALVATRKFSVLDRKSGAYEREKAFIQGPDTHQREVNRLGLNRGSDYVLTGNVGDVRITEHVSMSPLTKQRVSEVRARANYRFDLLLFSNRQVKFSASVPVALGKGVQGKSCREIVGMLSNKAAAEFIHQATQAIFPPMVLSAGGGQIIVNYGKGEIEVGKTFNLYTTGKMIYDPYTKESLGASEQLLGAVRVLDVKPKFSVVEMINPELTSRVKPGDVLRPIATQPKTKPKVAKPKILESEW